ncbi:MAG: hypothetical protein UHD09_08810 [Bifidobacterium sp.]|nr:hypothetical protein [Bifidobacterium sp.]
MAHRNEDEESAYQRGYLDGRGSQRLGAKPDSWTAGQWQAYQEGQEAGRLENEADILGQ